MPWCLLDTMGHRPPATSHDASRQRNPHRHLVISVPTAPVGAASGATFGTTAARRLVPNPGCLVGNSVGQAFLNLSTRPTGMFLFAGA